MRQLRIREEERGQIRQSEGADGRGRRVGCGRHVGLKFRIQLCMCNVSLRLPSDVGVMEVIKNII